MKFYLFTYWYDSKFKNVAQGPIKFFELADNLTDLGHIVTVFTPKTGVMYASCRANVIALPVFDVPFLRPLLYELFLLFNLTRRIIWQCPDIFYLRIFSSLVVPCFARLFKIPFVTEVPDDPYSSSSSAKYPRNIKRFLEMFLYGLILRTSHLIITASETVKKQVLKFNRLQAQRLTVFQSGANTSLFYPQDKHTVKMTLKLNPDAFYVGYVGSFLPHDDLEIVAKCIRDLIEKCQNIVFLFVGDGPMKSKIEKLLGEVYGEHSIFTGLVPYENVPTYINAMDVAIAPFRFFTGARSPVKIFDCLACGVPVVTSDVEGTGQFFNRSAAVKLVSPEDPSAFCNAIIHLYKHSDLRQQMGKSGRAFIESKFSRKQIAVSIASLCADILK